MDETAAGDAARKERGMDAGATPALIALDWGSSSLRAWLLDRAGAVIDVRHGDDGILAAVAPGFPGFDDVFERYVASWQTGFGPLPCIASGMIGSRQGWIEVPYCDCPASAADLAAAAVPHVSRHGHRLRIVPGLSVRGEGRLPDVMRGEETQILGTLARDPEARAFVLPGTHSKWARAEAGRIVGFATFMTGELYALLKEHSLLGRMMIATQDRAAGNGDGKGNAGGGGAGSGARGGDSSGSDSDADAAGFARGIEVAVDVARFPGGLSRKLFSVRSLALVGELPPVALSSYLSGLLIGSEVAEAREAGFVGAGETVRVVATPALAARYRGALQRCGIPCIDGPAHAAALGAVVIACGCGLLP